MTSRETKLKKLQYKLQTSHAGFLDLKRQKTGESKGYGSNKPPLAVPTANEDKTEVLADDNDDRYANKMSDVKKTFPKLNVLSNAPPAKKKGVVGRFNAKQQLDKQKASIDIKLARAKSLTERHRARVLAKEEYRKKKLEYRSQRHILKGTLPNNGQNRIRNINKSHPGPFSDKSQSGLGKRQSGGFFEGIGRTKNNSFSDYRPKKVYGEGETPKKRVNPVTGKPYTKSRFF